MKRRFSSGHVDSEAPVGPQISDIWGEHTPPQLPGGRLVVERGQLALQDYLKEHPI